MRVLIVDDDARVRRVLRDAFEADGAVVEEAGGAAQMRERMRGGRFDLIALDVGLPDEDGLSALRAVRRLSDVPVIMITGRGAKRDVVRGLEDGADDYIAKPFAVEEVVARARAVCRRDRTAPRGEAPERLTFDGWTVDLARREVRTPDGAQVALTAAEFELFRALLACPNAPLSRDELCAALGRPPGAYENRALDMQVRRLRAKIEPEPDRPRYIKTFRGRGYLFAAPLGRG